jgi:hypothetical protein
MVTMARLDGMAIVILDAGYNMATVRFANSPMSVSFQVYYDDARLSEF